MGGPVDDDMANLIVAQLLYLDSADQTKDITMYVNSPGGSVTAGEGQRSSSNNSCCSECALASQQVGRSAAAAAQRH